MENYKQQFIEFALARQVLKFGEFTLKSGRVSPYFFNAGLFNQGADLARLGEFYAEALQDAGLQYDMIFGPAYKGIPLLLQYLLRYSTALTSINRCALTAKKLKITAKVAI